jgi:hypothetical protein
MSRNRKLQIHMDGFGVYHKPHGLTFAILPGCRFAHSLAPRLLGDCIFMDLWERRTHGRGQPSGFHRCTGDSVGCRDAGLLDSGTES